jgi:N-acetylglucosamine repressor
MTSISPIQPKLLSRINERLVMRIIREKGPLTRAEISKSIGITFPTVNKAVGSLLDSNLLEEVEDIPNGPGRPAKRLRLASENSQVIGVTLSEAECVVAAAALDGVISMGCISSFPTPSSYDSLLVAITRHAQKLMVTGEMNTLCLAICIPGIVDYQEQRAVLSANMPMINGRLIGRDVQELLGIECLILRDAHAFSLSERMLHTNGDVVSNVAMLDHSEGIGLGMMVDNQFLTGNNGFAGELGHITIDPHGKLCHCGKHGCLETVASEWALEERASQLLGRDVHMEEILTRAKQGDKQLGEALETMCHHLALGVACVVNIFNPGRFYIYGRSFKALPHLLDLLVERTRQFSLEPSFAACEFVRASGGELDGTIACLVNYLTDSLVPDLDDYVKLAKT